MTKVFLESDQVHDNQAVISGTDAYHLCQVLRVEVGDALLVAVSGVSYQGRILAIEENQITVTLEQSIADPAESPITTRLFQGLAKGDKLDLVVQKAVELGVSTVIPFSSQHTVVKLTAAKKNQRQQRWQRIAYEAAKQCKRDQIPEIQAPVEFGDLLKMIVGTDSSRLVLMPYEHATQLSLRDLAGSKPQSVDIIIGPEGGFSHAEMEQVMEHGGRIITLGNRILRTETAAIVTLAMVQLLWGDLG